MARVTMPAKGAAEYLGLSYWKLLELVKQKNYQVYALATA